MFDDQQGSWPTPPSQAEVQRLVERARGGDPTEIAALRAAMEHSPNLWKAYGDLATHARNSWIALIAGPDLVLLESLERQVEAMKADLAGPATTPLENLLIERIVACWLQLGHADASAAQSREVSLKQADFARKRQDSAHRRYVMAVGALAMTRRLLGSAASAPGGFGHCSRSIEPGPVVGADTNEDGLDQPGANPPKVAVSEDGQLLKFGLPAERSDGIDRTVRPRSGDTR